MINNNNELNTFIYTIFKTGLWRGECLDFHREYIMKDKKLIRESISSTSKSKRLKTKNSYSEST